MPLNTPPCPDSLKAIQHYLTIASEHDARDSVVSYWCRLYALQKGLKIDKSSPEAKKLLFFLMDWLEAEKTKEKDNEAIAHDIPAQAHLENYALKLFLWADQQDRACVFNKNVVKAFYTAGMIYSVLETFGELTEEVLKNQKYAKWKAAYIHQCLKNGETPVPGPMGGEEDDELQDLGPAPENNDQPGPSSSVGFVIPPSLPNAGYPPAPGGFPNAGPVDIPPADNFTLPTGGDGASSGASLPMNIPPSTPEREVPGNGNVAVTPEMIAKAQKLCKFATSALNYDDVPTAVTNLQKALSLLTTGRE